MSFLNDRFGGISDNELYALRKKEIPQEFELSNMAWKLKKEGYLELNLVHGEFNQLYKITPEGRNLLFKQTNDLDFGKIVKLGPPEHMLGMRVNDISKFLAFGTFTFLFYAASVSWLTTNIILSLLFMGLVFALLPFTTVYFVRMLLPYINNFLEKVFMKTSATMAEKTEKITIILTIIVVAIAVIISVYAGSTDIKSAKIIGGIIGLGVLTILQIYHKDLHNWMNAWIKKKGESIQKEM